jgi:hypothetical protein
MPRLFVGDRELKFIADVTREFVKDVVGQKIYYYPISEAKTRVHDLYEEALQKVYDNPIAIDAIVDATFHEGTTIDTFGIDAAYRLEVFLQWRDLVEKGIDVCIGDFFSFSNNFYEITERQFIKNIYGMADQRDGVKVVGTKVRESQFKAPLIGATDIADTDGKREQFVQQRGFVENAEGPTNDVRELQRDGVLDQPLDGPREVSPRGDPNGKGSSFYDD